MNTQIDKAHSVSFEQVWHYRLFGKNGTVRLLAFYTNANMGSYSLAISTDPLLPDIVSTRQYGRSKYGFALNIEQFFNDVSGCFFKCSWNDGRNETWAFSEIDHAPSCGFSIRNIFPYLQDTWAVGYALNGLSSLHQRYLQKGELGFMLGDGNLNYGFENILESFYKMALKKNLLFLTLDYQFIRNPGYNKDRKGPVHVFSVRTHLRI